MRLLSLSMIKNNAIPSKIYKIVHATLNTHPAGVKNDFDSALYQTFDAPCGVNSTPIAPGINEITIAKIKVQNFFIICPPLVTYAILACRTKQLYRNENIKKHKIPIPLEIWSFLL